MSMDYEAIKAHAKELHLRVPDLLAMSMEHDPFYVGRPAAQAAGRWFAAVWVIALVAWQAGRPDLIRSLRLVLAHGWEGMAL